MHNDGAAFRLRVAMEIRRGPIPHLQQGDNSSLYAQPFERKLPIYTFLNTRVENNSFRTRQSFLCHCKSNILITSVCLLLQTFELKSKTKYKFGLSYPSELLGPCACCPLTPTPNLGKGHSKKTNLYSVPIDRGLPSPDYIYTYIYI